MVSLEWKIFNNKYYSPYLHTILPCTWILHAPQTKHGVVSVVACGDPYRLHKPTMQVTTCIVSSCGSHHGTSSPTMDPLRLSTPIVAREFHATQHPYYHYRSTLWQ